MPPLYLAVRILRATAEYHLCISLSLTDCDLRQHSATYFHHEHLDMPIFCRMEVMQTKTSPFRFLSPRAFYWRQFWHDQTNISSLESHIYPTSFNLWCAPVPAYDFVEIQNIHPHPLSPGPAPKPSWPLNGCTSDFIIVPRLTTHSLNITSPPLHLTCNTTSSEPIQSRRQNGTRRASATGSDSSFLFGASMGCARWHEPIGALGARGTGNIWDLAVRVRRLERETSDFTGCPAQGLLLRHNRPP